MRFLYLVAEDQLSESIAKKIISQFTDYKVYCIHTRGGRGYIEKRLLEYNRSAKTLSFFVMVDLDQSLCAVDYIKAQFGRTAISQNMVFRVAVKEVESWILADQGGFSHYFEIPKQKMPHTPDQLPDPKQSLVGIIKKYCRNKTFRENIVPQPKSGALTGPGYNSALIPFIEKKWSVKQASQTSNSLNRCVRALISYEEKIKNQRGQGD